MGEREINKQIKQRHNNKLRLVVHLKSEHARKPYKTSSAAALQSMEHAPEGRTVELRSESR